MKIVIDIPDGRYEELMTDDIHLDMPIFKEDIIATLPKGHGDLIDRSELLMEVREVDCDAAPGGYDYILDKQDVLDAPTIIEADKDDIEAMLERLWNDTVEDMSHD